MTKEELEKEVEEYVGSKSCDTDDYSCGFLPSTVEEMLIEFAEPREKRIAELEHQLTHRNCLDCSNHSSKLRMRTLKLEKENAELNEKVNILDNCDRLGDMITEAYKEQLTKAKEIIRDFLSVAIDYIDKEDKNYSFIVEAEQFLNEVEK